MRGIVPVEAGSRLGLLEVNALRRLHTGHGVESFEMVPLDSTHHKMRLAILACEEANELDRHTYLSPSFRKYPNHLRYKVSNLSPSLRSSKVSFTPTHSLALVLANAIPIFSWVGICWTTARWERSLTSHETTGKSLMNAPMRPADKSSRAVKMP